MKNPLIGRAVVVLGLVIAGLVATAVVLHVVWLPHKDPTVLITEQRFDEQETPSWSVVSVGDLVLSIPYASTRQTHSVVVDPIERLSPTGTPVIEDVALAAFGRTVNVGMDEIREYTLSRVRNGASALDPIGDSSLSACSNVSHALTTKAGRVQGVGYRSGGAKGCGVGFVFEVCRRFYDLYRVSNLGERAPSIDAEMVRIIESIRDSRSECDEPLLTESGL